MATRRMADYSSSEALSVPNHNSQPRESPHLSPRFRRGSSFSFVVRKRLTRFNGIYRLRPLQSPVFRFFVFRLSSVCWQKAQNQKLNSCSFLLKSLHSRSVGAALTFRRSGIYLKLRISLSLLITDFFSEVQTAINRVLLCCRGVSNRCCQYLV